MKSAKVSHIDEGNWDGEGRGGGNWDGEGEDKRIGWGRF